MSTDIGTIRDAVDPEGSPPLLVYVGTGGTALFIEAHCKFWLNKEGREKLIELLEMAPSYGAP